MKANRIKKIEIMLGSHHEGEQSRAGEYHATWEGIANDEEPKMSEEDAIVSLIHAGKDLLRSAFEMMLDESLESSFEKIWLEKKGILKK